jgi:hypothetical protein
MLLQCWRESEKEDEIKMILLLLLTGKKICGFFRLKTLRAVSNTTKLFTSPSVHPFSKLECLLLAIFMPSILSSTAADCKSEALYAVSI